MNRGMGRSYHPRTPRIQSSFLDSHQATASRRQRGSSAIRELAASLSLSPTLYLPRSLHGCTLSTFPPRWPPYHYVVFYPPPTFLSYPTFIQPTDRAPPLSHFFFFSSSSSSLFFARPDLLPSPTSGGPSIFYKACLLYYCALTPFFAYTYTFLCL